MFSSYCSEFSKAELYTLETDGIKVYDAYLRKDVFILLRVNCFVGDGPGLADFSQNSHHGAFIGACVRCDIVAKARYNYRYYGNFVHFLPIASAIREKWNRENGEKVAHSNIETKLLSQGDVERRMWKAENENKHKSVNMLKVESVDGYKGLDGMHGLEFTIAQYVTDFMHANGNINKDFFEIIGNDEKWTKSVLWNEVNLDKRPRICELLRIKYEEANSKREKGGQVSWEVYVTRTSESDASKPNFDAPWTVSNVTTKLLNSSTALRTLPSRYHKGLASPLGQADAKLNAAGRLNILGPMLIYYTCHLTPDGDYRKAFIAFFTLLNEMRQYTVLKSKVEESENVNSWFNRMLRALIELETIMPAHFFTINWHMAAHFASHVSAFGPFRYTWMFIFERYGKYLINLVHSGKNVVESVIRAHSNAEKSLILTAEQSIKRVKIIMNVNGRQVNGGELVEPAQYDSYLLHKGEDPFVGFTEESRFIYFLTGKEVSFDNVNNNINYGGNEIREHLNTRCHSIRIPLFLKNTFSKYTLTDLMIGKLEAYVLTEHSIALLTHTKTEVFRKMYNTSSWNSWVRTHELSDFIIEKQQKHLNNNNTRAKPTNTQILQFLTALKSQIMTPIKFSFPNEDVLFFDNDMIVLAGISPFASFHDHFWVGKVQFRTEEKDRKNSIFKNSGCTVKQKNDERGTEDLYGVITHFVKYSPYLNLVGEEESDKEMELVCVEVYQQVKNNNNNTWKCPLPHVTKSTSEVRWFSTSHLGNTNVQFWPWLTENMTSYTSHDFAVIQMQPDSFVGRKEANEENLD